MNVEFCQMFFPHPLTSSWFVVVVLYVHTLEYIYGFFKSEPAFCSWDKSQLVVVYCSFYIMLLDLSSYYFVEDFWVCVLEHGWSVVFFS